jgi:hypothetical protein
MTLRRLWYTAGTNNDLWISEGTYTRVPYENLPPIDRSRHDGSFAWLPRSEEAYGLEYGLDGASDDAGIVAKLDAITTLAKREGLVVPSPFRTFVSNREIHSSVPSCTACYLELADRLVAIHRQPGRLLRFLNDQQCCYVWCLHLLPGGGHQVVAATPEFGKVRRGKLEDIASFTKPVVCADDFEEFIHRFWLENVLWDVTDRGRDLTPEESAYLAHARSCR